MMLAHYFGFAEDPFGATPDPRFLYSSRTHREALASLQYAFCSNRGFTALIAPPGMGKTTLLFEFLDRVRDTARTVFLFHSQCDASDLLREILHDIGVAPAGTVAEMLQQLNAELMATARTGKRFVVVVDEAQNLTEPTLEMLRLLTNFETSRAKLMQIVLSGQPRLAETLRSPGLVQLRQRISTFCRLDPFVPEEVAAYIAHRLRVAGYQGAALLFTPEAVRRIAEESQGIPRNINTICFNALSLCCGLQRKKVELETVNEAIRDLQPGEQSVQDDAPSVAVIQEHSFGEARAGWRRMRIPALISILIVGAVAAFWATNLPDSFTPGSTFQNAPRAAQSRMPSTVQPADTATIPGQPSTKGASTEITVQPQETLSGISVRSIGAFDSAILRQIQDLNPDLVDPDLILPGQKILLPRRPSPPLDGSRPQ